MISILEARVHLDEAPYQPADVRSFSKLLSQFHCCCSCYYLLGLIGDDLLKSKK